MGKLTKDDLAKLIDRPGRHGDGQGLYFRAIGEKKAYFVYRYYLAGKEREVSIGPYPEVSLAEARIKHAALRKIVVSDKRDPLADKRAAKASASASASAPKPTFGQIADQFIETHESTWRSRKHAAQWRSTLTDHASAIRITPVDQIDTQAVLGVLKPIWDKTPETASRLRARIEAVLASAQVAGHIPENRPNPARWGNWLAMMLPNPRKVGKPRGHHTAMPYADLPAFWARLMREPGVAAKALAFVILTAAKIRRSAERDVGRDRSRRGDVDRAERPDEGAQGTHRAAQRSGVGDRARPARGARQEPARVPVPPAEAAAQQHIADAGDAATERRRLHRAWDAQRGKVVDGRCRRSVRGRRAMLGARGRQRRRRLAYQRSSMIELRRPVMAQWGAYLESASRPKVVALKRA